MRLLLRIVAGVLAVDVMVVAGLWVSAILPARRSRRQVRQLERLWALTTPTPVLRRRRSAGSWRVAAVIVAAAIALSGSVATNQHARHMVASALGSTTDRAGVEPGPPIARSASPTNRPSPRRATGARGDARVQGVRGTGTVQPPLASTRDAAQTPDPRTEPIESPPTLLGIPSSTTAIQVAWSDVSGENGYRVERSRGADAGWVQVATTLAGVTSYVDDGLAPGTTYYYRVFATTPEGDSPPSDVVSATTAAPPGTPIDVVAVSGMQNEIDLSWGAAPGATGYRLERSPDGVGGWSPIATTGQDVTTYADTGLAPKTTYFYRVVAVSAYGDGPPSDVVMATTSGHPLGAGGAGDAAPDVTV